VSAKADAATQKVLDALDELAALLRANHAELLRALLDAPPSKLVATVAKVAASMAKGAKTALTRGRLKEPERLGDDCA